ncbi:hypothetical protein HN903_01685 [archaeon]|jgi:hypothetical protein|nr:hypothetical protein [archaeon]MBT7128444.1 hypothetical protein [archaeon]
MENNYRNPENEREIPDNLGTRVLMKHMRSNSPSFGRKKDGKYTLTKEEISRVTDYCETYNIYLEPD